MTFTYSGDPSTSPVDELRFLLGDTQKDEPLLQDEELRYLRNKFKDHSIYYVAMAACDTLVARFTREIDMNIDGQSAALGQLMERYKSLRADFRFQNEQYAPEMDDPISWKQGLMYPPAFGLRQWDHPEAGLQEYGDIDDTRILGGGGLSSEYLGSFDINGG